VLKDEQQYNNCIFKQREKVMHIIIHTKLTGEAIQVPVLNVNSAVDVWEHHRDHNPQDTFVQTGMVEPGNGDVVVEGNIIAQVLYNGCICWNPNVINADKVRFLNVNS